MAREGKTRVNGQPGRVVSVRPEWIGWKGDIAHPASPAGGSGLGHFRPAWPLRDSSDDRAEIWHSTVDEHILLADARPPTAPNPPPDTVVESFATPWSQDKGLFDVSIEGNILADGTADGIGTRARVDKLPKWPKPIRSSKDERIVESFKGRWVWHAKVEIQTSFPHRDCAGEVSGYGRGTTPEDVNARNITLGFHESCHRADMIEFLKTHPMPLPKLKPGMTMAEFELERGGFAKLVTDYLQAMALDTETRTDEVGHRKSTKGRFVHAVPPEYEKRQSRCPR